MKAFKYFSSRDWERYLGCTLYDRLKETYHTNKGVARAFQTPFNFDACKAITGLHVSTGLTGKMQGIKCITTACTANPNCVELHQCGGVCEHCYAFRYLSLHPNVRKCYERNTKALSDGLIDVTFLPTFSPHEFVRFESFGDLVDFTHVENYLLIAFKNPNTNFVLFTKQRNLLERFFTLYDVKKPSNLSIVSSAFTMNDKGLSEIERARQTNSRLGFKLIDKVFVVYDNENEKSNNRGITVPVWKCEKRCNNCRFCWGNKACTVELIKESLK